MRLFPDRQPWRPPNNSCVSRKSKAYVEIIEVTCKNRDELPEALAGKIKKTSSERDGLIPRDGATRKRCLPR
jgi:hypothetical protein